jgi:hypothetical protein
MVEGGRNGIDAIDADDAGKKRFSKDAVPPAFGQLTPLTSLGTPSA